MLISMSVLFVLLVLGDQVSKLAVVNSLVEIGASARFIPGILRFEYYKNTGMAWGLFQNASWVFVLVTFVLGGGIVFLIVKYRRSMPRFALFAFTLILAGAVGNLIDRIAFGYVRDFLMFEFINFPVFNVADCCVTVGAALLAICLIFTRSGREFFNGGNADRSRDAEICDAENDGAINGARNGSPADKDGRA